MCQLLGMNAKAPTDVMRSFAGLATRAHALLSDEDLSVDFASQTTPTDRVALVATASLTSAEPWQALQAGEMRVLVGGRTVAHESCH